MSKSQAIEGVMKIFLMIAVIIVGMSFLLKAFGIDIFEWLKGLGGLLAPNDARILYIKMDPDDSDNDIYSFFLTKDPYQIIEEKGGFTFVKTGISYFLPESLPKDKCVIYVVDEQDSEADKALYYYVDSGVVLQEGCTSLATCLNNRFTVDCKLIDVLGCPTGQLNPRPIEECKKLAQPSGVGNCGCGDIDGNQICLTNFNNIDKREIEKELFGTLHNFVEGCELNEKKDNFKTPSKCNVLIPGEYKIMYGLLCGNDGIWHACKPKVEIRPQILNKKYTCIPEGDKFVWKSETVDIPDSSYTDSLTGWVGFRNTKLSLDDSRVIGEKSIKGHVDGDVTTSNRVTMDLFLSIPQTIKNELVFFAKVGDSNKETDIMILLSDGSYSVGHELRVGKYFNDYPYRIDKTMFIGFDLPKFNWNKITAVEFSDVGNNEKGITSDLFIDGLYFGAY